jgi:hypothetical protein
MIQHVRKRLLNAISDTTTTEGGFRRRGARQERRSRVGIHACNTVQFQLALGVVDYLRRRFTRFKLCTHLLDCRCLLPELHRESFYLFLLLRDRCLQFLHV